MRGGAKFKAVQIGGPSGGCLTFAEDHLDLPLDFDSLKKAGAMIGSGGLVVMDDSTCMVEVARFFMHFTQNESCGKCVPCREGTTPHAGDTRAHSRGQRSQGGDIDLLLELADTISSTALCGLGKTAGNPGSQHHQELPRGIPCTRAATNAAPPATAPSSGAYTSIPRYVKAAPSARAAAP